MTMEIGNRHIGMLVHMSVQPNPDLGIPAPRELLIEKVRGYCKEVKAKMAAGELGVGFLPGPMMEITMECGFRVAYHTEDEIPYEDVPCPCGDPTHWLIKYEVEQS